MTCPGSYFAVLQVLNTIYILFNLHWPWHCSIMVLFSLFCLKYQWIICLLFVVTVQLSWVIYRYHVSSGLFTPTFFVKAGHLFYLLTYDKFHLFPWEANFWLFFHLYVDILPVNLSDFYMLSVKWFSLDISKVMAKVPKPIYLCLLNIFNLDWQCLFEAGH